MKILLSILLTVVVVVSSERYTRQARSRDDDSYQTRPRRALVKPGGVITLLGNAGVPLQSCLFYLPYPRSKWSMDFSLGPKSNATDRYEYFGRGLEFGECGIRMKRVANDDDGIIISEVLPVGSDGPNDWERCVTTLRVTDVRASELPEFDIEPSVNLIKLAKGNSITIKCNADRPINMCHIYLPGPIFLNLDQGVNSTPTNNYRYHGNGLDKGECGTTLTNVDERLSGFVVCKIGSWPETVDGKWETDSFQVITREGLNGVVETESAPPIKNPNATSCPPLILEGVDIKCSFSGNPTDCSQPQRILSVANMKCKPGYIKPNWLIYKKIKCLKGGIWDPKPITCHPDCGKRITNEGVPFISNGANSMIGEFPWHVGIYRTIAKTVVQECGGSLITSSIVVSAAHCFWDHQQQKKKQPSLYRVAAGKHTRMWSHVNALVQRRKVLDIILPKEFNGRGTQFNADIALVRLSKPFEITTVVNLVCIDLNHEFESKQLILGNEGIVTGWGYTENNTQSDILQYVALPYRPRDICLETLNVEKQQLLTEDKFCAGFINKSTSVCSGDSGGGLVFLEPLTNKYYLRGLVSLSFMKSGVCNTEHYTGFTKFDQYIEFVQDNHYFDYSKLKRNNSVIQNNNHRPIKIKDDDRIIFPHT